MGVFVRTIHETASGNSSWRTSSASACSASIGPWIFALVASGPADADSATPGGKASSEAGGEGETFPLLSVSDGLSSCLGDASPPTALTALGSLSATGGAFAFSSLLISTCGGGAKMSRPGSAFPASTVVSSASGGASAGTWPRLSSTTIAPRPAGSPPIVASGWEATLDFCGVARIAPLY